MKMRNVIIEIDVLSQICVEAITTTNVQISPFICLGGWVIWIQIQLKFLNVILNCQADLAQWSCVIISILLLLVPYCADYIRAAPLLEISIQVLKPSLVQYLSIARLLMFGSGVTFSETSPTPPSPGLLMRFYRILSDFTWCLRIFKKNPLKALKILQHDWGILMEWGFPKRYTG